MPKLSLLEELAVLQEYDYRCLRCGADTNKIHTVVQVPLCDQCYYTWAYIYPYAAISVLRNLKVKYKGDKTNST